MNNVPASDIFFCSASLCTSAMSHCLAKPRRFSKVQTSKNSVLKLVFQTNPSWSGFLLVKVQLVYRIKVLVAVQFYCQIKKDSTFLDFKFRMLPGDNVVTSGFSALFLRPLWRPRPERHSRNRELLNIIDQDKLQILPHETWHSGPGGRISLAWETTWQTIS